MINAEADQYHHDGNLRCEGQVKSGAGGCKKE